MSPAERLKVLLFLALFFGATGFLSTLLSCGTEYWLLAAETCSQPEERPGGRVLRDGKSNAKAGVRMFHEGLFWRCSFEALSHEYSMWDIWIIFRTFWSIFLVTGVAAVVIGGFIVMCAGPLSNHKLYKVGLCLLAVLVMYLMWVQVLDTLEQFVLHQRVSSCPSFHLSIQHGPSFLLAPVAVFFCLLAGVLFILVGQTVHSIELEKRNKIPELAAPDACL
eukprot:superscaffoldBa00001198_g9458